MTLRFSAEQARTVADVRRVRTSKKSATRAR